MTRRNFILLIIILALAVGLFFLFLYTRQPKTPTVPAGPGDTNFVSTFPQGGGSTGGATTTPPADLSQGGTTPTIPNITEKLTRVSSMPVAGFFVYNKERLKEGADPTAKNPLTETVLALRYVARATGNIYETFADVIEEQKVTQTIIPKVYEAYFGNGGNSVVMRYLQADNKTIQTFVGTLPKEYLGTVVDGTSVITGTLLPDNITDVSTSSDAGSLFYLFGNSSSSGGNATGTTLNFGTNKKVQIFSSPFTEWLPEWPNSKMITLTTKASAGVPGYMYSIDPGAKGMTKVIGGINGLTTLTSPNGKLVLLSDDSLALSVYHTDTGVVTPLGVKTMAEKCVWSGASNTVYCAVPKNIDAGQYPDTWYQGEVSFSDQIWKIDVGSQNATMLIDPPTVPGGVDVDAIKLALDPGENYLCFVNKKDSYLWELKISN